MKVTKEIFRCRECPYIYEVTDMGARFYACPSMILKHGIDGSILKNIDVISDECPLKEDEE